MTVSKSLNILIDLSTFLELRNLSRESEKSYSHIIRVALGQYLDKVRGLKEKGERTKDVGK